VVVAAAAAVLSFAALHAHLCAGFPQLAWLLPVVVDAPEPPPDLLLARRLGQRGRRVRSPRAGAGLLGYRSLRRARPWLAPRLAAWWVVVVVSAVAPAVLGAVVHLAVLVGHLPDWPDDDVAGGP
jgi:hypothetical protein